MKGKSGLEKDVDELKMSVNEWVLFLNHQQRDTKTHLKAVEKRLRELELEKELRDRRL